MVVEFILIMTIFHAGAGFAVVEHVTFESRGACYAARDEWLRQMRKLTYSKANAFCVIKK